MASRFIDNCILYRSIRNGWSQIHLHLPDIFQREHWRSVDADCFYSHRLLLLGQYLKGREYSETQYIFEDRHSFSGCGFHLSGKFLALVYDSKDSRC